MAELALRFMPPQYKTESMPQINGGSPNHGMDKGESTVHTSMLGFGYHYEGTNGNAKPLLILRDHSNSNRAEDYSSPRKRVSLPPQSPSPAPSIGRLKTPTTPVKLVPWRAKVRGACQLLTPFSGIAMALCQCMCVAFSSLLISSVRSVSPLQITTVRMLMQLLLSLPPLIFAANEIVPCRDPLARRLLIPLYIRCVAGTIGVTCLTFSMVYAPIADASTISYTSPIYVALLARIFLKEAIALADAGLLVLALVGVIFVTRPPFLFPGPTHASTLELLGGGGLGSGAAVYPHRVLGLCFAVASSILTAIAMVTIRKINKLPFSTVLVNFSLVGTIGTSVLCAALKHFTWPTCTGSERAYIVGAAVLGTAGQFFLFCALRLENAGVVAAINSVTIVFTILLQIVFVHKVPPWTSWLGSGIIIIAIVCFGYRKWLKEKEKDRVRGYPRKRTLSLSISRIPSSTHMSQGGLSRRAGSTTLGPRTSVLTVNAGGPATDTMSRKRRVSYQGSLGGSRVGGPELFGVAADSFMIYEVENEDDDDDQDLEQNPESIGFGPEPGTVLYDSQHLDALDSTPLAPRPEPETPDEQQLTTNTLIVPSY